MWGPLAIPEFAGTWWNIFVNRSCVWVWLAVGECKHISNGNITLYLQLIDKLFVILQTSKEHFVFSVDFWSGIVVNFTLCQWLLYSYNDFDNHSGGANYIWLPNAVAILAVLPFFLHLMVDMHRSKDSWPPHVTMYKQTVNSSLTSCMAEFWLSHPKLWWALKGFMDAKCLCLYVNIFGCLSLLFVV